jgi:hypothetical protein
MASEDEIPGWVAVFISLLVCFPCFCCSTYYAFIGLKGMSNPEWVSELGVAEIYPPAFGFYSVICSGWAIIALVGGITLLVWGLRRVRTCPVDA